MNQKILLSTLGFLAVGFLLLSLFRLLIWLILSVKLAFRVRKFDQAASALIKKRYENQNFLKKLPKSDEELFRKKQSSSQQGRSSEADFPEAKPQYQTMESMENENSEEFQEDIPLIVDYVRPIGKWTALILGRKLSELLLNTNAANSSGSMINNQKIKGFWTNMITQTSRANQRGR